MQAGGELRRLEADLDLAVDRQLDRLLVARLAVEPELGHPPRRRALRPHGDADRDRLVLRAERRQRLGGGHRHVTDRLGREPHDERRDPPLVLLRVVEPLGHAGQVPRRAGQVGQDVDLVPRLLRPGHRLVRLPDRAVERPVHGPQRQRLDPLPRRRRAHPGRGAGLRRVDYEDAARFVRLLEDLAGAFLRLVEPRLVALLIAHRQAGVEDQGHRRRHLAVAQRGPRPQSRPRQRDRHQGDQGHARQQEQPVLDLQPLARPLLTLLDQPERREQDVLRRLPHEQVQDHRQRRQRHARRQPRVQEDRFHVLGVVPGSVVAVAIVDASGGRRPADQPLPWRLAR